MRRSQKIAGIAAILYLAVLLAGAVGGNWDFVLGWGGSISLLALTSRLMGKVERVEMEAQIMEQFAAHEDTGSVLIRVSGDEA